MSRRSLVYTAVVVLFLAGIGAIVLTTFTVRQMDDTAGEPNTIQNQEAPRKPTTSNVPPAG
jgi:hypothetical protein